MARTATHYFKDKTKAQNYVSGIKRRGGRPLRRVGKSRSGTFKVHVELPPKNVTK